MAKAADPRMKVLRLSLKESLAGQNVELNTQQIDVVIKDVLDTVSLFDCGGGGCKKGCNTGCLDGCKDVAKAS